MTEKQGLCGRCHREAELFPAVCREKPEQLRGQPLGMYHCPDCGAMVLAGIPHPPLCGRCLCGDQPMFGWPQTTVQPASSVTALVDGQRVDCHSYSLHFNSPYSSLSCYSVELVVIGTEFSQSIGSPYLLHESTIFNEYKAL